MNAWPSTSSALRVGVSAVFDPADTPHARTFLRALCVARNTIPNLGELCWLYLDDRADKERGAEVARRFIASGVDLVIGHFSSDAAAGAAPLYADAGIALLTPAATLDCLTLEHGNVFRFCPSDRRIAADLASWLKARRWQIVHIDSDDSAHGRALARALSEAARQTGLRHVARREDAQVEIFAGRLRSSRQHWLARRCAGSFKPLVLTDDAASPELGLAREGDRHSYVIGFGWPPGERHLTEALHEGLFDTGPGTYYRESLLLLHVLAQLASSGLRGDRLLEALRTSRFSTPLGDVAFDHGERRGVSTQVWRVGSAGLVPVDGGSTARQAHFPGPLSGPLRSILKDGHP